MNLWTRALHFLREAPGVEEPAAMPAANDPHQDDDVTELEELRREVYQQRIKITGLSKKLRALESQATLLKRKWPEIHKQVFPLPEYVKRN